MAKKTGRGQPAPAPPKSVAIRPLGRADWPVIEELFGDRGACGGCWCMTWRVPKGGKAWDECKGEPNRRAFRALVKAGQAHGMLAFADGRPVGWCSFGPAASFPRMLRSRVLARRRSETTWSVTCFFILPAWRGRGLSTRLLGEAVRRAFELGATEVEGFPAAPTATGRRLPAPFVWTGVPAIFRAAGFEEEPDPPGARPIYVKRSR